MVLNVTNIDFYKIQAKHIHLDVQRVAIRCLGLFGLLERKPSEDLIKQLRMSFLKGPSPISVVACKALVDLAMWHGPQEVDRAMGHNLSPQSQDENMSFNSIECSDTNGDTNLELLDFLCTGLDQDNLDKLPDTDESESVKSILGEGFAKMLLLSEKYPSISTSLHPSLLLRLISMYFHDETKDMERLFRCAIFHVPLTLPITKNDSHFLTYCFCFSNQVETVPVCIL